MKKAKKSENSAAWNYGFAFSCNRGFADNVQARDKSSHHAERARKAIRILKNMWRKGCSKVCRLIWISARAAVPRLLRKTKTATWFTRGILISRTRLFFSFTQSPVTDTRPHRFRVGNCLRKVLSRTFEVYGKQYTRKQRGVFHLHLRLKAQRLYRCGSGNCQAKKLKNSRRIRLSWFWYIRSV